MKNKKKGIIFCIITAAATIMCVMLTIQKKQQKKIIDDIGFLTGEYNTIESFFARRREDLADAKENFSNKIHKK